MDPHIYSPRIGDLIEVKKDRKWKNGFEGLQGKVLRTEPTDSGRYHVTIFKFGGGYFFEAAELILIKPSIITVDSIRESLLNRLEAARQANDYPTVNLISDILNQDF